MTTQNNTSVQTVDNTAEEAALLADMVVSIEEKMAALANAERVTKVALRELSRELLFHYQLTGDVCLINKLLGLVDEQSNTFVLTPMNWKVCVLYFRAFIPHGSNYVQIKDYLSGKSTVREPFVFGKKSGNRAKKIGDSLVEWLEEDANNIWTWQSENVSVETRPKNYFKEVAKAVTNAMDEEKGNLSTSEVIQAVMEGGVSADEILALIEDIASQSEGFEVIDEAA